MKWWILNIKRWGSINNDLFDRWLINYIIAWIDLYAEKKFKGTTQRRKWVFLTHWGSYVVVFCNVMISTLFNYMHRNGILHTVNNSDAG
jgi:hypothetical protein